MMQTLAGAKISITEDKEGRKYSGTFNAAYVNMDTVEKVETKNTLRFEMSLKIDGAELDKRVMRAGSPRKAQRLIEGNVLIDLMREDGTRVKTKGNDKKVLFSTVYPFIYQAYGLLTDQLDKQNRNMKPDIDRSYTINGMYCKIHGEGKKLDAVIMELM